MLLSLIYWLTKLSLFSFCTTLEQNAHFSLFIVRQESNEQLIHQKQQQKTNHTTRLLVQRVQRYFFYYFTTISFAQVLSNFLYLSTICMCNSQRSPIDPRRMCFAASKRQNLIHTQYWYSIFTELHYKHTNAKGYMHALFKKIVKHFNICNYRLL